MIHPGVGEYNQETDQVEYKAYYQWVPFVLFLQACFFYTPHMLLKLVEGGKVAGIISGLHQRESELHDEERSGRHAKLAKGRLILSASDKLTIKGGAKPSIEFFDRL